MSDRFYREKAIGGSDVCHTCEAHVVAIFDLEKERNALAAELAAEKSRLPALGDGYEQLWLRAKTAEDRIRELEAQNTALLADVNQDEGYERMKARNSALEAAAEKVHGIIAEYWGPCMGSVESLLTLREAVGERASTWLPKVSDLPRVATVCTCDSTLVTDTSTHQPHCPRYVAETLPKLPINPQWDGCHECGYQLPRHAHGCPNFAQTETKGVE